MPPRDLRSDSHPDFASARFPERERQYPTPAPAGLTRAFGWLVAIEAAYACLGSATWLVRVASSDVHIQLLSVFFILLIPALMVGGAYVLLRPRLAESQQEALLRTLLIWAVIFINVVLVLGLLMRPEAFFHSPL